ncbi:MAG: asparaginase domain-containing protein [Phycisphaerales bacterium]
MRHLTLITTGGTIEKTYDEQSGSLENRRSIVDRMVRRLRLEDTSISTIELMSKDSQLMTPEDRETIAETVEAVLRVRPAGIVILHGTDTLTLTGEHLQRKFPTPAVPIILTGAMRPFEMRRSDALQNLTESLMAAGILAPGVYCVTHGRALQFPGVVKDRPRATFVKP